MYPDAQAHRGYRHSVEGKSIIGQGSSPRCGTLGRGRGDPSTFTNPRGLSTVEREARPAEVALYAAALPGLSENDKVMSGQYEARPKDDLHNTLSKHR